MVKGAKYIYHSKRYKKVMDGDMLLWTIIDKTIYLQVSEYRNHEFLGADYDQIVTWYN